MKYAAMKAPEQCCVTLPAWEKGVDGRAGRTDDTLLPETCNVWWEQEMLQTRPALRFVGTVARRAEALCLLPEMEAEGETRPYWLERYEQDGQTRLWCFCADEAGAAVPLSREPLAAAYGVIAAVPEGWLAITDSGLFRLRARGGVWEACDEAAYVPLVMRGGRGCLPTESKPSGGQAYEEYNRLTDRFSAAYTTDGASTRFYLPQAGLANDAVTAVIDTADGGQLTYRVAAGQTDSAAADGRFMRVNRQGGYVQFRDAQAAEDNPLPAAPRENNMMVTAAKNGVGGRTLLAGLRQGCWLPGDQHRAALVLFGDPADPALICWSAPGDPLYMPQSHFTRVGDPHSAVTAITRLRDRLVLFKPQEIYMLTPSAAEGTARSRFSFTRLPVGAGCHCPATIQVGEERLLWMDGAGQVRMLTADRMNGREPAAVMSEAIAPMLAAYTTEQRAAASAAWWHGRYLLGIGRDVWVLDPRKETAPVWFCWRWNEQVQPTAWAARGEQLELWCRAEQEKAPVWAVYRVQPDTTGADAVWDGTQTVTVPIPYAVHTRLWDGALPDKDKRLRAVEPVEWTLERATLTLRTERGEAQSLRLAGAVGREIPCRMARCRQIALQLNGSGGWRGAAVRLRWQLYPAARR